MKKTRNLSPIEYYKVIQKEYLSAKIRQKIARSGYWRTYYRNLANKKSVNIKSFSERNNNLANIISDSSLYTQLMKEMTKDGFPNFTYKNKDHRLKLEPIDYVNFYSVGVDVLVIPLNKLYKVAARNFKERTVSVMIDGERVDYSPNDIFRIL